MLIALISDIHANVYGLEAVLNAVQQFGPEKIICAGDIIGYYPFVNETIDLLRRENITCILGNHDAALIGQLKVNKTQWQEYNLDYAIKVIKMDNLKWLKDLPLTLNLELEGLSLEVYHGSPWSPLTQYIYPDFDDFIQFNNLSADYVILGHTHWPLLHQTGSTSVINPGSCGQPRNYVLGACYALLDITTGEVIHQQVTYNLQPVVDRLEYLGFDQKLIDILYRTKEK